MNEQIKKTPGRRDSLRVLGLAIPTTTSEPRGPQPLQDPAGAEAAMGPGYGPKARARAHGGRGPGPWGPKPLDLQPQGSKCSKTPQTRRCFRGNHLKIAVFSRKTFQNRHFFLRGTHPKIGIVFEEHTSKSAFVSRNTPILTTLKNPPLSKPRFLLH